jgi:FKBP-type peptidyl-prolyl cis-trans isomerase FklB
MSNNTLKTDEQKVSYGFGLQFGQQLQRNQFDDLDLDAVYQGLRTAFNGEGSAISEVDLNKAYEAVGAKRKAEAENKAKQLDELGKRFLQENAKREGVTVTESGLQYEMLEAGDGEKPDAKATVKTHYHGTFIDGSVFDSSVDRNEPAEFGVNEVIKGWTEVLQLMPVGSKWRIAVPAELAYGEAGSPPVIPGNSVLVFEIHLLDIL